MKLIHLIISIKILFHICGQMATGCVDDFPGNQLPTGLPSVVVWKASSLHLYDSFKLMLNFLKISFDLQVSTSSLI